MWGVGRNTSSSTTQEHRVRSEQHQWGCATEHQVRPLAARCCMSFIAAAVVVVAAVCSCLFQCSRALCVVHNNTHCPSTAFTVPYISALRFLDTLDIADNDIWQLPRNISSLTALRVLRCSRCMMMGALPDELAALTRLQSIDLSFNLIESLPVNISTLVQLTYVGSRLLEEIAAVTG
jgi:Leucine-rich repeat (LRR) protein